MSMQAGVSSLLGLSVARGRECGDFGPCRRDELIVGVGLAMQEKHRTEKNERFFKLYRGDVIAVTVSLGPELVTVPDVVGKNGAGAKEAIEAAGSTESAVAASPRSIGRARRCAPLSMSKQTLVAMR